MPKTDDPQTIFSDRAQLARSAGQYKRKARDEYDRAKTNAKVILDLMARRPDSLWYGDDPAFAMRIDIDIMRDAVLTQLHRLRLRAEDAVKDPVSCVVDRWETDASFFNKELDTCAAAVGEIMGVSTNELIWTIKSEQRDRVLQHGQSDSSIRRLAAMYFLHCCSHVVGIPNHELARLLNKSREIIVQYIEEGRRRADGTDKVARRKFYACEQRVRSHFDILSDVEN